MLKRVVATLLKNYETALGDRTKLILEARVRKDEFAAHFRHWLFDHIEEIRQSDPRLTIEESSGGYMFYYKNRFLFRAVVTNFSNRSEVLIDRLAIVTYNGESEILEKDMRRCELAAMSSLLQTLKSTLQAELLKELDRV